MITLNMSKADCKNVADFLELYFFQNLHDDPDIDNIEYIRSLLNSMDELNKAAKE